MTVATTIHERPTLLCLFYSDTEKIRFVIFETLLKCLNKVLRAFNWFVLLTEIRAYIFIDHFSHFLK